MTKEATSFLLLLLSIHPCYGLRLRGGFLLGAKPVVKSAGQEPESSNFLSPVTPTKHVAAELGPNSKEIRVLQEDDRGSDVYVPSEETGEEGRPDESKIAKLFAIFDTSTFSWGEEIVQATLDMINNKTDGWFDDLFPDGTILKAAVANSACDPDVAFKAYWDLAVANGGPPHGLVGARCTGASSTLANFGTAEGFVQVSPASTSAKLSQYPFFSRTTSQREVDAIVALLTNFGWQKVSIISTDTPYSEDLSTAFHTKWVRSHWVEKLEKEWTGSVVKQVAISLTPDESMEGRQFRVDQDSARQALASISSVNSRVFLLIGHNQHVYDILRIAKGLLPADTIFIGATGWMNRLSGAEDLSWLPEFPGYLGVSPYQYRDERFLERFNTWRIAASLEPLKELRDYSEEFMVDAIIAIAKSLSSVRPEERRNATLVTNILRQLRFAGVSGQVSFTEDGDRRDPVFAVWHMPNRTSGWVEVGSIAPNEASIRWKNGSSFGDSICFPIDGCFLNAVPPDSHDPPLETWIQALIGLLAASVVIGVAVFCVYLRNRHSAHNIIEEAERRIEEAERNVDNAHQNLAVAKQEMQKEIAKLAEDQEVPEHWDRSPDGILVKVSIESNEYWDVCDELRKTMPNAHISQLWRVQNKHLYAYYTFHKKRFNMANIEANEKTVWHGTGMCDPRRIYSDTLDGWMIQHAEHGGLWGRGAYFAEGANYSDDGYSFQPAACRLEDRAPSEHHDERELLLATLLVGDSKFLQESRDLTMPPMNPATNKRYNTVVGETLGTTVYIVYENGRAHPEYLVRYYHGARRDEQRTLYGSRAEMMAVTEADAAASNSDIESPPTAPETAPLRGSRIGAMAATVVEEDDEESQLLVNATSSALSAVDGPDRQFSWCFQENDLSWRPYSEDNQHRLEDAYTLFLTNGTPTCVDICTRDWNYRVSFGNAITQKNLETDSIRQVKRFDHYMAEETSV